MIALDSTSHWLVACVNRIAADIFRCELCDIHCPTKLESIRFSKTMFVCAASEFFDRVGCVGRAVVELTGNSQICSMLAVLACLQAHVALRTAKRMKQGEILN